MNKQVARRGITAALLAAAISVAGGFSLVPEAKATLVDINTCWSSCTGLTNVTIATLNVAQHDADTVNFTLTNQVGALAVATPDSFISALNHTYTGSETLTFASINTSAVGGSVSFAQGSFTNASLSFNLLNGYPTANTPDRFTHGEQLSWSLSSASGTNLLASQFLSGLNGQSQFALVHAQGLTSADGSTKFVNGVPEPASLLLLGAGLAGIGIFRRKSS